LPLTAYLDKVFGPGRNALGFGANRGLGWGLDPNPGHSPVDAAINANLNWTTINQELFGWGTGSLVLFFVGLVRFRDSIRNLAWVAIIALVIGTYSLYYFSGGPDFAARYWFLAIVPLIVLSAQGFRYLCGAAGRHQERVIAATGILVLAFLTIYLPWRSIDKYHEYLGMTPGLRQLNEQTHFGRSLVLIQGKAFPDYASAVVYNPLDLRTGETIYAHDSSPAIRNLLLRAYPDRQVWIVEGPSITGAGYRVVRSLAPGSSR
jgi:hypothetical protein